MLLRPTPCVSVRSWNSWWPLSDGVSFSSKPVITRSLSRISPFIRSILLLLISPQSDVAYVLSSRPQSHSTKFFLYASWKWAAPVKFDHKEPRGSYCNYAKTEHLNSPKWLCRGAFHTSQPPWPINCKDLCVPHVELFALSCAIYLKVNKEELTSLLGLVRTRM